MKNPDTPEAWLKRAKSNIIIAKNDTQNDFVYYEDLCFNAQQCVEKSLKLIVYLIILHFLKHIIFLI
jgi:HEPN domain-containing protein